LKMLLEKQLAEGAEIGHKILRNLSLIGRNDS
jgi:hypothetical protein